MPAVHAVSKTSAGRSQTVAPSRSSSVAVQVTTTIVNVQTATSTAPDTAGGQSSTKLPVGVLLGSIAGGVVLAIVVVLGWTFWGKSYRRRQRDQVCTVLTTKDDTHRHLSRRAHRTASSTRSPEKSHLDISPNSTRGKACAYDKISTPDSVEAKRQPSPPHVVFKPVNISQPRMLRKNRKQTQLIDRKSSLSPITDVDNETVDAIFEEPSVNPFADTNTPIVNPVTVSRHTSTAGSASVYSTQSGEERQYVVNPSFVLAALGPPGLDNSIARPPPSILHKVSNVSSIYSSLSGEERQFGAPGQDRRRLSAYTRSSGSLHSTAEDQLSATWVRRDARSDGGNATQLSRLSQISSPLAYPTVDDQSAIGLAYGGEAK